MTPAQTAETAQTIVLRLLAKLTSHKELEEAWGDIDEATKVAIVQTLVTKTHAVLDGSEPGKPLPHVEAYWLRFTQP